MIAALLLTASLFSFPTDGPFGFSWGASMELVEAKTEQAADLVDVEAGRWRIVHMSPEYGLINYFFDNSMRLSDACELYDRNLNDDEVMQTLAQFWRGEGREPDNRDSSWGHKSLSWDGPAGRCYVVATQADDKTWSVFCGYMKILMPTEKP